MLNVKRDTKKHNITKKKKNQCLAVARELIVICIQEMSRKHLLVKFMVLGHYIQGICGPQNRNVKTL